MSADGLPTGAVTRADALAAVAAALASMTGAHPVTVAASVDLPAVADRVLVVKSPDVV